MTTRKLKQVNSVTLNDMRNLFYWLSTINDHRTLTSLILIPVILSSHQLTCLRKAIFLLLATVPAVAFCPRQPSVNRAAELLTQDGSNMLRPSVCENTKLQYKHDVIDQSEVTAVRFNDNPLGPAAHDSALFGSV